MVAAYVDDNHDDDDDVRSLAVQLIKADKSRVKRSDNIADTDARRAGRSGRSGRRVEQAGGGGRRGGGGKRRWRGGAEVSECLDEAARGGEVVGGSRKGRWAQIVGAWASGGERRGAGDGGRRRGGRAAEEAAASVERDERARSRRHRRRRRRRCRRNRCRHRREDNVGGTNGHARVCRDTTATFWPPPETKWLPRLPTSPRDGDKTFSLLASFPDPQLYRINSQSSGES